MIGCIVQARSGSKRFPKKIYEDLNGKSMLYRVLESLKQTQSCHKIILAMPDYDQVEFERRFNNDEFEGATDHRFRTYFGHPEDLVDRYYNAALRHGIDLIIRATADCVFCGSLLDEMVIKYHRGKCTGFMGNNELVSSQPYPDGCDLELFQFVDLVDLHQLSTDSAEREHVTPRFYGRNSNVELHPFFNCRPNTMVTMKHPDFSFDTEKDRNLVIKICKNFDAITEYKSQADRLNQALLKT